VSDRVAVSWRGVLGAPWSWRTWRSTAHLVTGCALGLGSPVLVLSFGLLLSPKSKGRVLGFVFGVLVLAALFALTRPLTACQRARFDAFLRVPLARFPRREAGQPWVRWMVGEARTTRTRRQVGYHLLAGLTNTVATVLVVGCWSVGVVLAAVPLSAWLLPGRGLLAVDVHHPAGVVGLTAIGVVLFLAVPWLARGAAAFDTTMARALLQPTGRDELARRVESLSASRAGAVDAADAERRRIERNLHDGTQQRLVSLAMNLGMTRAALGDAAPEIREAVAGAHEEAKQALAELRGFIRGLHPAILDELGLDAALSGIAARSPVPVRLTVSLPARPSRAVEAVAYFVVSETLTNVARHAGASRVEVVVRQQGSGHLRLSITDDGRGGADPRRGTGLRGLQQRVESVDGTLRIDSPPGGTTSILVELPCAS
jgi:signal transduction histidine kinase